jgi:hypothetical protein
MYGYYDIPLRLEQEGITLSLELEGESLLYRSVSPDGEVEKVLLARANNILINPVEPLHKPKELTSNLLIEFERNLLVEPGATRKIFVTFPIEIGVFVVEEGDGPEVLDLLTLATQKFTLYGDPRAGVICKYWRSGVHPAIPAVNPLHEGVMELTLTNTTTEWAEVTRAVFNAYGMKIYYSDSLVAMRASMKIIPRRLAETDFQDAPLLTGMTKSLELYTSRKLPVVPAKFVMEAGL